MSVVSKLRMWTGALLGIAIVVVLLSDYLGNVSALIFFVFGFIYYFAIHKLVCPKCGKRLAFPDERFMVKIPLLNALIYKRCANCNEVISEGDAGNT